MKESKNKKVDLKGEKVDADYSDFVSSLASGGVPNDVNAMVQHVLREAYSESNEDLKYYAEKIRKFNKSKKTIRKYLVDLREFKANVLSTARELGIDLCNGSKNDQEKLAKVFEQHAYDYDVGEFEHALCIPNRVPPESVKSIDLLEIEIARWSECLATVGDDSQLAQIDLQNALQKQQQVIQTISNVSKMTHDTALAVIRKIG